MRGGNVRQPRKSMAHHSPDSRSVAERRRVFRRMHEHGCFVIPNPWDLGSARVLVQLGFQALGPGARGLGGVSHRRSGDRGARHVQRVTRGDQRRRSQRAVLTAGLPSRSLSCDGLDR